jgi:small subunit ribosomal protein S2
MEKISQQQLLDAGVHFGHLKKKWNPKMLPYIFMERKGIHIIDLNKTQVKLEESAAALRQIAKSGRKILFVATKKQAKDIVAELANSVNMPFVAERWLGGMLTNFSTIRKSIKKKQNIEKMLTDGSFNNITKKERLMLARQQAKLDRVLGGIENLGRVPAAVFMVDISHEHIALAEAKKLGIKTFGIVDTNSDPTLVDFAVPGNDDASKSIKIITEYLVEAIKEGLADRKRDKEVEEDETHEDAESQEDSAEEETKEEETKEESSETAE